MEETVDYDSADEVNEDHSRLVSAVSNLDKTQHIQKPSRSEPTLQSSEFHLVKSNSSKETTVTYTDLVKVLGKTAKHAEIGRKLRTAQKKTKTLQKPLEKPQAERIQRVIGFENVKKELEKWDAVVSANRVAPHRSFPLIQADVSMKPSSAFLSRFRLKFDLEKELEALKPPEVLEENEKEEFPLTLEEIKERRKEAAKLRALQSYQEAKARRQNKIKSKKFHRIEKRNKMKKKLKELEILQKTNPEAALKELEEIEKIRAGERASLRHHSTGKWAQNLQLRAKHDHESRAELAQQLSIYRDLTQKVKSLESSDSEGEEVEPDVVVLQDQDVDNPWTKEKNEIDEFVSGYRKFWSNENQKDDRLSKNDISDVACKSPDVKDHSQSPGAFVKLPMKTPQSSVDTLKSSVDIVKSSVDSSKSTISTEVSVNSKKSITPKKKIANCNLNQITPSKSMSDAVTLETNDLKKSKKKHTTYTSPWLVTDVDKNSVKKTHASKLDSIDALFDDMEDDVQTAVNKKIKNLRKKYEKNFNGFANGRDSDSDQDKEYKDLSFKNNKKRPVIDEELDESVRSTSNQVEDINILKKQSNILNTDKVSTNDTESIDPNKFMNLKPKRLLTEPADFEIADDMIDDDQEKENRHSVIAEAFEDDDIVSDFRKEKQDAIDKDKPQDVDLSLPGWGTWGGKNIKNIRKRKRFTIKVPKKIPRKDENRGDLIINENVSAKLKTHMVSELPFPFTSVSDFEASIRAPIVNTFIPVNASKKLTKPAVTTKLGAIIEPMDENMLVKKKRIKKSK